MTSTVPTSAGDGAGTDGVGAEIGADRALLDDGERGRQRARAQQQRLLLGLLGGEGAGDDAAAAADRALHDRGADDLVVELDGQPLADVGAGGGAEGAAAGGVEGEADDRPAALLLLEGGLGVVEILAAHDHALEHRQALRLVAPADLLGRHPRVGRLDLLPRLGIGRAAAPACPRASAPGRWWAAASRQLGPAAATSSLTRWKVSLAVWLILRLRSVVSLMPGTCSRMRSSPWRTMVGSMVPVSSTRRRRISIDWSITSFLRRNRSWSE